MPIEALIYSGENVVTLLHKLCCKIWNKEIWPEDWCIAECIPIPKKGDLLDCKNYRTVALISHASKILLIIMLERMKPFLDDEIAKEQAGFRSGRGTRDHLFNLFISLEKQRTHNSKPTCVS